MKNILFNLYNWLGLKYLSIKTFFISFFAAIPGFIHSYIWENPAAIYTLVALYVLDFLTGFLAAIKNKQVQSKKIPIFAYKLTLALLFIGISHNIALHNQLLSFLGWLVFTSLTIQNFISLLENMAKLNVIDSKVFNYIKERLDLAQITQLPK